MNGLTASAFGISGIVEKSEEWLANDLDLLTSDRKHYVISRMRENQTFEDVDFLKQLSEIRQNYQNMSFNKGPYHTEVFPWDYAAPERALIAPGADSQFTCSNEVDAEVESLILELNTGHWG